MLFRRRGKNRSAAVAVWDLGLMFQNSSFATDATSLEQGSEDDLAALVCIFDGLPTLPAGINFPT